MTALRASLLKGLLNRYAKEWSVLLQRQERASLHLTRGGAVETSIETLREQADATIYQRSGVRLGDAHFTLFSVRDEKELEVKERIREAKMVARLSMKEAWPLPGKQQYKSVATSDPAIRNANRERLLMRLWQAIERSAKREAGVRISHSELAVATTRNRVFNSEGLDGRSVATSLFVELIMTARRRGEEQEFHQAVTVGRLSDFSPSGFVKACASKARDVLRADSFRGLHKGPVILSESALRDFWAPELSLSPLVAHANAQAKHRGLSTFETGKRLSTNPFSLVSDPFVPYNPSSGRFDTEGSASRRVELIKEGVVSGFFANQRYAHYLGIEPTGALGVVKLLPGPKTFSSRALRSEGGVEIVSFSSFVPNSLSGDFSAEIRLGYIHSGGRRIPFKNAMFTGNLFLMLDSMRCSGKEEVAEGYAGPSLVRFDDGCHVAGF